MWGEGYWDEEVRVADAVQKLRALRAVGIQTIVYPTAPGTIAGDFDGSAFEFKNFTFTEILNDFLEFRDLLRQHHDLLGSAQ